MRKLTNTPNEQNLETFGMLSTLMPRNYVKKELFSYSIHFEAITIFVGPILKANNL